MTEATYNWISRNRSRGVQIFGFKGASSALQGKIRVGKPLDKTPSGRPMPGGIQIVLMDTHKLKDAVYWRLGLAKDGQNGGMYLHKNTDIDFARQILAEEKRRTKKGIKWVTVRRDNHYLDCLTVNLACACPELYGGVGILKNVSLHKTKRKTIARSKFIGG